jgi:hypothetical protein
VTTDFVAGEQMKGTAETPSASWYTLDKPFVYLGVDLD